MLRSAMMFFILGLITMFCGAYGIGDLSIEIAKVLLMIFITLSILSFTIALIRGDSDGF